MDYKFRKQIKLFNKFISIVVYHKNERTAKAHKSSIHRKVYDGTPCVSDPAGLWAGHVAYFLWFKPLMLSIQVD